MKKILMTALFAGTMLISNDICASNKQNDSYNDQCYNPNDYPLYDDPDYNYMPPHLDDNLIDPDYDQYGTLLCPNLMDLMHNNQKASRKRSIKEDDDSDYCPPNTMTKEPDSKHMKEDDDSDYYPQKTKRQKTKNRKDLRANNNKKASRKGGIQDIDFETMLENAKYDSSNRLVKKNFLLNVIKNEAGYKDSPYQLQNRVEIRIVYGDEGAVEFIKKVCEIYFKIINKNKKLTKSDKSTIFNLTVMASYNDQTLKDNIQKIKKRYSKLTLPSDLNLPSNS